ncbi:PQQ-binding-like beta-propeller repeat protein [Micromonospora sp. NPDC126480]|uniref:outer membrane protein assembly factor BamB family protein n=1 Tax=Micromonospora sp. NPDC126480 TaxID=3155312 RepID=UPI003321ABC7
MSLIDLGELRDDHRPEPPVRRRRPGTGAWGFPVVLLLALLTLVASVPVPGRETVVVPAGLGVDRMVVGDLLLVVAPRTPQASERSMTAYRLPGVERVWQAPVPVDGEFWHATARGDVVLVTGNSPQDQRSATMALDARTGEHRWRLPGSAVDLADGNVLLEESSIEGGYTFRAVDPCCGTPRWQLRLPLGEVRYRFAGPGLDRLVTRDPEGLVEVRDTGTGAVLAAADLDPAGDDKWSPDIVGDLLFVSSGSAPEVTAYGLDRLDRRWRATAPANVFAVDCGAAVCFQSRSGAVRAVDAATGRPAWNLEGWSDVWALSGRLLAVRFDVTGGNRPYLAALDPATGAIRAELGRWELAHSPRRDEPLIGLRPHPGGGLFVAELDLAAGVVRPLDVLPEAAGDCEVARWHLLCRRPDASLGLWPLRH